MKKQYIKPNSEIYSVELQGVLAETSGLGVSSNSASTDYPDGASAGERKWGSLW